ncbi:MAG TPA: bacterioferritin [Candidatus Krumholzibacteria bacterium]|nr:bacterioferritin [Candidatus Krumholzibacteria bacterium]
MKVDAAIVEALNDVLTAELTAINQYFIHHKMCANWEYQRLAKLFYDESMEEMQHADKVIDRILYLDGVPNMQRYFNVLVGENVKEMHEVDLKLETTHVERLNKAIVLCREHGDNGSRLMLEEILADTEEAVDWNEAQLEQIETMGIQNYLSQQIRPEA